MGIFDRVVLSCEDDSPRLRSDVPTFTYALAAEEAKVLIKVELNELYSSSSSSSQAAFHLFLENVDCWLTYFAACHKTLHSALHIIEIERERVV